MPYLATLKSMRRDAKKSLSGLERTYQSLPDKDSWYAGQVLAVLKIQQQVCDVYDNAPDEAEQSKPQSNAI
jgi:hypothetical protein